MSLSLRRPAHLEELLNFRLLRLFALSGAPVVRLLEGRYGITRREWRLLGMLVSHGASSPSQLAEWAQLDRPRTSNALGKLVAKQLVERVAEPGDRRRAQVALTAQGRQLYDTLFPQVAAINAQVVAALDDAGVEALDAALAALTARAMQVNAELVRDVRADRRAGGSRRLGHWPESDL